MALSELACHVAADHQLNIDICKSVTTKTPYCIIIVSRPSDRGVLTIVDAHIFS